MRCELYGVRPQQRARQPPSDITPTRLRLTTGEHGEILDPRWLRLRTHREVSFIDESNSIPLGGKLLRFDVARGAKMLPKRTKVLVSFGLGYCEVAEEVQLAVEELKRLEAAKAAQIRVTMNRERDEAIAYNAKIKLSVAWQPGIKMVRSGLSANSSGKGRNKATVVHITLLEPFKAPRIGQDHSMTVKLDSGKTAEVSSDKSRNIDYGYAADGLKNLRAERVIATGDGLSQETFQGVSPKTDLALYTNQPQQDFSASKEIAASELAQPARQQHDFGIGF